MMFKKVFLLGVILVGGMWAAGYNLDTIGEAIGGFGDNAAGDMTGSNASSDWGR